MKAKRIRHKWKINLDNKGLKISQCQICGLIKKWDFGYNAQMYFHGTKITYNNPGCKLPNTPKYNKINL